MLTKAQATQIANNTAVTQQFINQLTAAIEANALRGVVGVTAFPYPPSASAGQISAFTTARQGEGWTVSVDTVGFTVTIS